MMRLGALLIALIVALLASVLLAGGGQAQGAPQVQDTAIRIDEFPSSVTFTALIADGAQAAEVVFFYTILPEGALTRQPAEVMRGDVTRASAVVETSGADIYIPVGADIEWFWELTSNDGTVIETEREIWRYEDPRYEWDELARGDVVVRYYDSESVAAELAVEGLNAVEEMTALLGITVDFPLKVYVWRSEADAQGVQRVRSEGFDEQVITGGVRVLADLVHIYQPDAWVIRHELDARADEDRGRERARRSALMAGRGHGDDLRRRLAAPARRRVATGNRQRCRAAGARDGVEQQHPRPGRHFLRPVGLAGDLPD